MKILGILIALLGGVLKLVGPGHLNLVSGGAAQMPGMGDTHVGLVPVGILIAGACAFIGNGRMAGIALLFVAILGIFIDGGLLIALPSPAA